MSGSTHYISKSFSGYETPDGRRCLPSVIKSSLGDCPLISNVKFSSSKCSSRWKSAVCNVSSSNNRRNPDFSRQNRHGFSRNRNRPGEKRDDFEDLEESESLMSKNGPLLAVSGSQKSQAAATPGPREREIVELFRKVQAQLRERAAVKEEKKVENVRVKNQESETVDSLLKLLRKHSVQKGKKNVGNAMYKDFVLDGQETVSPSIERSSTSIAGSDLQESMPSNPSRPKSSFRKRSPVPKTKFPPVYPNGSANSATHDNLVVRRKGISLEPEDDDIHKVKIESDEDEPLFSEESTFNEMPEDEDEIGANEAGNLSGLKLTELRALAKSRGIKGFSKLKKLELIELLSSNN